MNRTFYPSEKSLAYSDGERVASQEEAGNKLMSIVRCIDEAEIFLTASRSYTSASRTSLDQLKNLVCTAEVNINSAEECIEELETRLQKIRAELQPLFQNAFLPDSSYCSGSEETEKTSSTPSYFILEHVQQNSTEKDASDVLDEVNGLATEREVRGGERPVIMHPEDAKLKKALRGIDNCKGSWKAHQQNMVKALLESQSLTDYINKRIDFHMNDLNKMRDDLSDSNGREAEVEACQQKAGVRLEPSAVEEPCNFSCEVTEPINETNRSDISLSGLSLACSGKHSFTRANPVVSLRFSESGSETQSSNIQEKCRDISDISHEAIIFEEYSLVSDFYESADADNSLQSRLSEAKCVGGPIGSSKTSSSGKTDVDERSCKQPVGSQNEGTVDAHSSELNTFHRIRENRLKELSRTNICLTPPPESAEGIGHISPYVSLNFAMKQGMELEEISSYQPNAVAEQSEETVSDRNVSNSSERLEACTSANSRKTSSKVEHANPSRVIPDVNRNVPTKIPLRHQSSRANDQSPPNKHFKTVGNVGKDHPSKDENIITTQELTRNGPLTSLGRARRLKSVPFATPRQPHSQPLVLGDPKSFSHPRVTKAPFCRKNTPQINGSAKKSLEAEKTEDGKARDVKSNCNGVLINTLASPNVSSGALKKESRSVKSNPSKRFHLASDSVSKGALSSDSSVKHLFSSNKSFLSCSCNNDGPTSTHHASNSTSSKKALHSSKLKCIQNKKVSVIRKEVTTNKKLRDGLLAGNKVSNRDNSSRPGNRNFSRPEKGSLESTAGSSVSTCSSLSSPQTSSRNSTCVAHKGRTNPGNSEVKDKSLSVYENSHICSFSDNSTLVHLSFDTQQERFETSNLLNENRGRNVTDVTRACSSNAAETAVCGRLHDVPKSCLDRSGAAGPSRLSLTERFSRYPFSNPMFASVRSQNERLQHSLEKSLSFEELGDSIDKLRLDISRSNPKSRNSKNLFTTSIKRSSTPTPDYNSSDNST